MQWGEISNIAVNGNTYKQFNVIFPTSFGSTDYLIWGSTTLQRGIINNSTTNINLTNCDLLLFNIINNAATALKTYYFAIGY